MVIRSKQEKITMSINVDMKTMFSQVKKTNDYINDSTYSLAKIQRFHFGLKKRLWAKKILAILPIILTIPPGKIAY